MNTWITAAARYLFVCWVAEAHEDPESEFDAGDGAAGPGDDWLNTVPTPDGDPEAFSQWGTHANLADAWVAANVCAARLYAEACARRLLHASAVGRRYRHPTGPFVVDLEHAIRADDTVVSITDHAIAAMAIALGQGVDEPSPVGGFPWPVNVGAFVEFEPNPLR